MTRLRSLLNGLFDGTREFDRHKIIGWIEIALTGLVYHSKQARLARGSIWNEQVDLPRLEGCWITFVIDTHDILAAWAFLRRGAV